MGTVAPARSTTVPKGQVTQLCVRISACGKGCTWRASLLCLATLCLVCSRGWAGENPLNISGAELP